MIFRVHAETAVKLAHGYTSLGHDDSTMAKTYVTCPLAEFTSVICEESSVPALLIRGLSQRIRFVETCRLILKQAPCKDAKTHHGREVHRSKRIERLSLIKSRIDTVPVKTLGCLFLLLAHKYLYRDPLDSIHRFQEKVLQTLFQQDRVLVVFLINFIVASASKQEPARRYQYCESLNENLTTFLDHQSGEVGEKDA